jgi:hypothetical protein
MQEQNQETVVCASKGDGEYANPQDMQILFQDIFDEKELAFMEGGIGGVVSVVEDALGRLTPGENNPECSNSMITTVMDLEGFDCCADSTKGPLEDPFQNTHVIPPRVVVPDARRSTRKSDLESRNMVDQNEEKPNGSTHASKTPRGRPRGSRRTCSDSITWPDASPLSGTSPGNKKPKKHESNDPEAKNARAAKLNREKKKQAMESLKKDNTMLQNKLDVTSKDLTEALDKVGTLEAKVKELENKNRAVIGLNRISQSTQELLLGVMPTLVNNLGFPVDALSVAPWFSQVTTNTPAVDAAAEAPTSNYITMYVSMESKKVMLDYRPDEPVLSDRIPE